jgi:hypothetical protein
VPQAVSYIKGLQVPKNSNEVYVDMQKFKDEFNSVQTVYNEANQPPDDTNSFCLIGDSPPCLQLLYNNGFKSVYQPPSGLHLPAAVLFWVINKPAGTWSTGVFNFEPATTQ